MVNFVTDAKDIIAFQGELGANSHMACIEARPELSVLPCHSFEEMLAAVQENVQAFAMVPVENSSPAELRTFTICCQDLGFILSTSISNE